MKKLIVILCSLLVTVSVFAADDKEPSDVKEKARLNEAEAQLRLSNFHKSKIDSFDILGKIGNSGEYGLTLKWLLRAAYQGYPQAQIKLAHHYLDEKGEISIKEALYWGEKALAQNYYEAYSFLGYYYYMIDDKDKAIEMYKKHIDWTYSIKNTIDSFSNSWLKDLGVKNYTPVKSDSWNEQLRYESYYTIGGKTKNEYDSISESKEKPFSVYIKIYDNHIEVDGEELVYEYTINGYKAYGKKKGLFDSAYGKYYLVDQNYNVIYQDYKFAFLVGENYLWTDAHRGKIEDLEKGALNTIENEDFFASQSIINDSYNDLEYITSVDCCSAEETGAIVPVGIYRSKRYPQDYFFSFMITTSGISYEMAYRFIKEPNTVKDMDFNCVGFYTKLDTYFYFNFEILHY